MNKRDFIHDFSDPENRLRPPTVRHHDDSPKGAGPYSGPRRRVFTLGIGEDSVRTLAKEGFGLALELGPQPTLAALAARS